MTIREALPTLLHKTLYDKDGVQWGLSGQERDERDRWLERIEAIGDQKFRGVVVPITPVEDPNIFQYALAKKLAELHQAGVPYILFFRDDGYSQTTREKCMTRTKQFLEICGAGPLLDEPKNLPLSFTSTSARHKLGRWPEHQQLKEMLARCEMKDAARLAIEETHLAALYAVAEVGTPFLMIGYNEKAYVDIIGKFLPEPTFDDEAHPVCTLMPIYLCQMRFQREFIRVRDALADQQKPEEATVLATKLATELDYSPNPQDLLVQLDAFLLDREKPICADAVAEALRNRDSYQAETVAALEKQLGAVAGRMHGGE